MRGSTKSIGISAITCIHLLNQSLTVLSSISIFTKEQTALEVVGYSSQRFTNGVMFMLKEKRFTLRIFSRVLAMALISSVVVGLPSANAIDPLQVHDSAALVAAGLDPAVLSVKITADITLASNLVINHSMTITRGDLYTSTVPTLSGRGIEINSASVVTMSYLGLSGTNQQTGDGNYGAMVQGASTLNASHITMALSDTTGSENLDGFNVASGSVLNFSDSTITWASGAAAVQQYAVYAQSGAGAITLSNNAFDFSANNTSVYSYLIGVQGDLVTNYPTMTLSGNTNDSFMKLFMYGADTIVNKQSYANSYVTTTVGDNKAGIVALSGIGDGIYTRTATVWSKNITVNTLIKLRAAVLIPNATINLTSNIVVDVTNLIISNDVTINGESFTVSGLGVEINSAANVVINHLTMTGVNTQPEGMYGVMIQGASHLTGNYITMTPATLGLTNLDNTAFNVASGSRLTLSNSAIGWARTDVQQYAVYAQSGAGAISLTSNAFTFTATNTSGAYSYLIGMQGDLVSNYPTITLTGNTKNSRMNLLMSGADTVAHKQTYADAYVTSADLNNKAGIIDGISNGIYTKYAASWGVMTVAQLESATAISGAVVNLGKDLTLTSNLAIANGVSILDNGFVFALGGFEITTTAATVTTVTREVQTVVSGPSQVSQVALVAVPASATLQLTATTTMTTTGGTGDGALSYLTTTPSLCSVTGAGVVTAIAVGSCLVTATKAASGNYFAAISPVIAITISDSEAVAAAKIAADKVIADAAAKVIADKVIADAAAKAAADAAAATESGGGEPIAKEDLNTIRYAIATKTKSIFIDLADKYADLLVAVDVKKTVVKNGNKVTAYVSVETVALNEFGRAIIKTLIDIKVGNVIRVSVLSNPNNIPIKYVTVK